MVDFDCVVTISLPFLPLSSPSRALPNSPCPPAAHLHVSDSFGGPSKLDYGSYSSDFKGYDWLTLEYCYHD
ncbi:hypothetical protein B0H11DRAFT_2053330 [Mycena galericulata]|nr:hypothetical protein B0H11DRAFT_2053330 [Mycena galericulata]